MQPRDRVLAKNASSMGRRTLYLSAPGDHAALAPVKSLYLEGLFVSDPDRATLGQIGRLPKSPSQMRKHHGNDLLNLSPWAMA